MSDLFPEPWPEGFAHLPNHFDAGQQRTLLQAIADALPAAPFYQPRMPRTGAPTSVVMTNFGPLGWVSDREGGYRYQPTHPETRAPWPAMPDFLTALWRDVTDYPHLPECCLVNWYRPDRAAKMGAHIDNDEHDARAPIVGVSLGDTATFRLGNLTRGGPTRAITLHSGDVVVLAGPSRRRYHAVSKVHYGSSDLLPHSTFPGGGRINLTLRRVGRPT